MAIFVGSICAIWKVSISIDYDGSDGGRTQCTRGAWCPLGIPRTCNRATWDVSLRKGGGAMDSITGIGASNDIDGWGGGGGEEVSIDVTWGGTGKSNDIDGSIGVRLNGMVVSGRGERTSMDTSSGENDGSNDIDGWNRGRVYMTGGCEGSIKVDAGDTYR